MLRRRGGGLERGGEKVEEGRNGARRGEVVDDSSFPLSLLIALRLATKKVDSDSQDVFAFDREIRLCQGWVSEVDEEQGSRVRTLGRDDPDFDLNARQFAYFVPLPSLTCTHSSLRPLLSDHLTPPPPGGLGPRCRRASRLPSSHVVTRQRCSSSPPAPTD